MAQEPEGPDRLVPWCVLTKSKVRSCRGPGRGVQAVLFQRVEVPSG